MNKKIIFTLLVISISSLFSLDVPPLRGRINDLTGTLTGQDKSNIESALEEIETKTKAQVAVLLINSLEGKTIEGFSMEVVDKWKLGGKKSDNGVLLLVSIGDKKLRIEVGYGIEGALTDAKSHYIIRKIITPYFKAGNISQGIGAGVLAIGGVISNEYQITPGELVADSNNSTSNGNFMYFVFLFMVIFSGIPMLSRVRHIQRTQRTSGSSQKGFMALLIMELMLSGRRRGMGANSLGGFSTGGGFSGGGGSFGGGGASGGW